MAYENSKGLTRVTASDKIFRDKAVKVAKNPNCDGYRRGLASMVYKFFDKKLLVAVLKMGINQTKSQLENCKNQLLENSRKEKYTHLL